MDRTGQDRPIVPKAKRMGWDESETYSRTTVGSVVSRMTAGLIRTGSRTGGRIQD